MSTVRDLPRPKETGEWHSPETPPLISFSCVFICFSSFITDIGPDYLFGWGIWWCCPVWNLLLILLIKPCAEWLFHPGEQWRCCVWRMLSLLCFGEMDLAFLLCLSRCQPPQKPPHMKMWYIELLNYATEVMQLEYLCDLLKLIYKDKFKRVQFPGSEYCLTPPSPQPHPEMVTFFSTCCYNTLFLLLHHCLKKKITRKNCSGQRYVAHTKSKKYVLMGHEMTSDTYAIWWDEAPLHWRLTALTK